MTLEFTRSISETGLLAYMTDASTYGGAAPVRASLGLVALATYKHSDGDQIIEPTAYLAEDVTSFSWDVEGKDGVWVMNFWGLPLWADQVLAEGDVVLDVDDDRKIKKYIDGELEEIDIESLLTDEDVLHTGSKDVLITTELTIIRDNVELILLGVMEQYQLSLCEFQEYQEALKDFNYVRVQRSGAFIDFCRGNYIAAQDHIETGIAFGEKVIEEAEES